jgi:hypothetical protein
MSFIGSEQHCSISGGIAKRAGQRPPGATWPSDRRTVEKLKQNRNQLRQVTGLLTGYPITSLVRGAWKR